MDNHKQKCNNYIMDVSAQSAQTATLPTVVQPTYSAATVQLPKDRALDLYKEYCATGGLEMGDDGNFKRVSAQEFAERIGWGRRTLYDWQKSEPNFWADVNAKREQLYGGAWTQIVWRGVFLRAAKGDYKQAEMFLSHHSNYVPPSKKSETENSSQSWTGLLLLAEKRKKQQAAENQSLSS